MPGNKVPSSAGTRTDTTRKAASLKREDDYTLCSNFAPVAFLRAHCIFGASYESCTPCGSRLS